MAQICSCDSGITNFGQPTCVNSFGADARLVFVQYYDNSGNINSVKSTDTLDSVYFDGLINAGNYGSILDKSKRWYLTETINSVEGVRAESVKQEIDGISFNVKQGVRNYKGVFYGGVASPKYVSALKSVGCLTMGYFIIDTNGNLIGMKAEDGNGNIELRPIKIQSSTFDAIYKYPSKKEVQNITIMFDVEENEKDENINQISSSDIAVDLLAERSVATVNGYVTTASATDFTLHASFDYGTAFNNQALTGLTVSDIVAYNSTTSSPITISAVNESPDGTYLATITAQTTGDVITVNINKAGFEMTELTYTSL